MSQVLVDSFLRRAALIFLLVASLGENQMECLFVADISDRDDRHYIYNGKLAFLVSSSKQSRTGYRGKRTYTKLGNLAAHAVTWEKTQIRCKPLLSLPSGSPTSAVPFKTPGYFSGDSQSLINDAVIQFYKQAANTNALLPLMLKERVKTIDMVTEKVLKFVALKKNFLREVRKSYKGNDHRIVQNRWLEYRYGWLPTLSDINTLVNKPLGVPGTICSGRAHQSYSSDIYQEGGWKFNQNGYQSVSVQALLIPRDPFMKTASQYGIANPALVAWELVPYSFAVDWIFNIGGYLEHLGALNGLEMINPTCSWRHTFHQETYIPARPGLSAGYGSYKGSLGKRTLGIPSYPNPFIPNNGLNLFRFFDSVALLKGQFDRVRR